MQNYCRKIDAMNRNADYMINKLVAKYGGGEGGRTGTGSSKNGIPGSWVYSMKLATPKKWDVKSLDKAVEPANEKLTELQEENQELEVGYFLRYNEKTNELWADFFIGLDEDTWANLNIDPYNGSLGDNEMIIGFVHTHPGVNSSSFGPDDLMAISKLSLGEFSWTKIPEMASFTYNQGWGYKELTGTTVLYNNSSITDKMYFGVFYSNGYDSFSWNRINKSSLQNYFTRIYAIRGQYTRFLGNPQTYNADYNRRRK